MDNKYGKEFYKVRSEHLRRTSECAASIALYTIEQERAEEVKRVEKKFAERYNKVISQNKKYQEMPDIKIVKKFWDDDIDVSAFINDGSYKEKS